MLFVCYYIDYQLNCCFRFVLQSLTSSSSSVVLTIMMALDSLLYKVSNRYTRKHQFSNDQHSQQLLLIVYWSPITGRWILAGIRRYRRSANYQRFAHFAIPASPQLKRYTLLSSPHLPTSPPHPTPPSLPNSPLPSVPLWLHPYLHDSLPQIIFIEGSDKQDEQPEQKVGVPYKFILCSCKMIVLILLISFTSMTWYALDPLLELELMNHVSGQLRSQCWEIPSLLLILTL